MKQEFKKTYQRPKRRRLTSLGPFCSFALPPSHYFPLVSSRLVVPSSPAVPSFRLAWWRRCRCLAVLQWYPFPPREQLLAAVGISMNIVYILN
jgi:hypothetical protein